MRGLTYILLFFWCNILLGQQYNFEFLGIEEGLPQSTIYKMFQDSRGYLWFGTDGSGICRYDGRTFNTLKMQDGLAGNMVRDIIETRDGKLWIATENGISVYDGLGFSNITGEQGLHGAVITSLFQDSKGHTWAGSSGAGAYKIKQLAPDSFQVKNYSVQQFLSNNFVFDVYEDKYQRVWLACFGGGINILELDGDSIRDIHYLNTNNCLPSDRILCLEPEGDGYVWGGTYDQGTFRVRANKQMISPGVEVYGLQQGLSDVRVWDILHDGKYTWLATDKGGANRIDQQGNVHHYTRGNGLLKDQLIDVFRDKEGYTWFSMMDKGVCRYLGKEFVHLTKHEGLDFDNVYNILPGKNGEIWLACEEGGLYKTNADNKYQLERVPMNGPLEKARVKGLAHDKKGRVWIASSNGIARYDGKSFYTLQEKDGLINNKVNCIYNDSKNQIWCGTVSGINKLSANGQIYKVNLGDSLINEIQAILEDPEGNTWFGTLGGLVKFHGGMMTSFDEAEGLYHKKINTLVLDSRENLWIGTLNGGIYILPKNTPDSLPIQAFANDSLLNSNNVKLIAFENDTTVLAGTDKGLNKLFINRDLSVKKVCHYGKKEGYKGIDNNENALARVNGKFWFGTVKGVTIYDPEESRLSKKAPGIHITNLKLAFKDIDWKQEANAPVPWFNLPGNLVLPYHQNHISFHYIGLYYSNPGKVKYRYKLEGLRGSKWSPPVNKLETEYPGLPPGDYTFLVTASNGSGTWSPEPARYPFAITPPFWQTWWFYLVCLVIITLVIIFYVKYRERKLKQERDRLDHLVKERTKEVVKQKVEIEEKNEQITSSIKYAQRIQQALLPAKGYLDEHLSDHFVLFKPRDIVSGDFYWANKKNNHLVFVAADCTGHGVPGAFMSMLGISFLDEIVIKNDIITSDSILNELRSHVITALKQKGEANEAKDGMDMALCSLDLTNNTLEFSGANNPLYLIRGGELMESKADKMPVAIYAKMKPFQKDTFELRKGDTLYIFSDGYVDQFGGPDGRKFMKKNFKNLLIDIHNKPMKEQHDILDETIKDWMNGEHQLDDMVVMGVKI